MLCFCCFKATTSDFSLFVSCCVVHMHIVVFYLDNNHKHYRIVAILFLLIMFPHIFYSNTNILWLFKQIYILDWCRYKMKDSNRRLVKLHYDMVIDERTYKDVFRYFIEFSSRKQKYFLIECTIKQVIIYFLFLVV